MSQGEKKAKTFHTPDGKSYFRRISALGEEKVAGTLLG